MPTRLQKLFKAPAFDDEDKNRQAELVHAIAWVNLIALGMLTWIFLATPPPQFLAGLILKIGALGIHLLVLVLLHRGQVRQSAAILVIGMGLALLAVNLVYANILEVAFSGFIILILVAVLLLGWRTGLLAFILSAIANGVLIFLQATPLNNPAQALLPKINWPQQVLIFAWVLLILFLVNRSFHETIERANKGEAELKRSYSELLSIRSTLEAHTRDLERRIVQLQVASEVARDAASLQEVEPLLDRAVNLVRERFGFYHAGIFMIDEQGEYAVLKSATGEAGREMIARGHKLKVGEVGIVGYVTGTGHPRIALDVGTDAVYFQNPLLPETRSEMALPLKTGNIVIGALDVQSKQAAAFDDEDISILQTMADQLAVAIANARLFEATRSQLEELRVLNAVTNAGAIATSEDELLSRVTDLIAEIFSPDNFGVLLLDKSRNALRAHPSYRGLSDIPTMALPLGKGVSGQVAKNGKPRRVSDVRLEPFYVCIDSETRSELCVPIIIDDQVVGVINAESRQLNAFNEGHTRLLATIAGQLAIAMQKIRLFEAFQRRANELESLRQASLHLASNLNLESLLEVLLKQAVQLVTVDTAHIFLYDGEKLRFGAAYWAEGHVKELHTQPRPHGVTYHVAHSKKRIVISDVRSSSFFQEKPWDGALVSLPLMRGDQVLGVMNMAYHGGPHEFDEDEIRVLDLLGDQAALALHNAQLYAESQRQAKELAEALAQREELDRIKDEFIQNVSHELRTPLAIIRGYVELLETRELGELTQEQKDAINILMRRVNMLIKMVDDLVTILEAETRNIASEEVNLSDLVLKTLSDFKDAASRAELTFTYKIPPEPLLVTGSYSHLNRMLDNLISNAIKFTPPGGAISIEARLEDSTVVLEVNDTGIGISPDKIGRIFERFYQVDGSTKRRFGGIGLGLALVKEIVEAHRGTISVTSEIGKGSTFTVRLPTCPKAPKEEENQDEGIDQS